MKFIGLFILVILLVVISGCTQETPAPATGQPTTVVTTAPPAGGTPGAVAVATPQAARTASTAVTTIHIRNNTFVPSELTVLPGTGISWINDDSAVHIVKATGDHEGMFTSGEIVKGGHFGHTFGETLGTYEFTDPTHPGMKGTIFVKKGDVISGSPVIVTAASS